MEQVFQKLNKIYIIGAGSRAKTLTGYLAYLYPAVRVMAYLVDELDSNDSMINGITVQRLGENTVLCTEYPIFIATKGIYHKQITELLFSLGFKEVIPITPEVDNFLRNTYVQKVLENEGKVFQKIESIHPHERCSHLLLADEDSKIRQDSDLTAHIYMAKSIYDKVLQTPYVKPDYEIAIQVGAALTEQKVLACELQDNVGENISDKNRQYCELTALYWMWKHAREDVVGLSHYRRHFVLPKDWLLRMSDNDIDVILPVPAFVQPSIEENYRERHDAGDLDTMFSFLEKRDKEDYHIAKNVFAGNLYYPCNMFIMKKEILNEFCEWLFPVLDYVAEKCGIKEDAYLNRYPGFLSERLLTVFFTKYRNKYRIVFADKIFVS